MSSSTLQGKERRIVQDVKQRRTPLQEGPQISSYTPDKIAHKYDSLNEIGEGSFGRAILVRKRTGKDSGKVFVMKKIRMNELSDEERLGALNEVRVLQMLKHPNIIGYREYFEDTESRELNIIMDFADKGDLFQRIQLRKGKFFNEEQVLQWFVQIILAMKHVHDQNILHRDLKTQNIFLSGDNDTIKLGDFGIAKILNSETEMAKTVIGTPYYLSPELCEDKPYNQKSDVWALGCILYEMTTLKHAFNGTNLPALILKILRGMYPPISDQYSKEMRNLISSMLQTDPDLRPSLEEILSMAFIQIQVAKVAHVYVQEQATAQQRRVQDKKSDDDDNNPKKTMAHDGKANVRKSLHDIRLMRRKHQMKKKLQPTQKVEFDIEDEGDEDEDKEVAVNENSDTGVNEERGDTFIADDKSSEQLSTEDDDDWLDDKVSELQELFSALHPSQKLNLATMLREKAVELKQIRREQKQEGRRQFYRKQLDKVSKEDNHGDWRPLSHEKKQKTPQNHTPRAYGQNPVSLTHSDEPNAKKIAGHKNLRAVAQQNEKRRNQAKKQLAEQGNRERNGPQIPLTKKEQKAQEELKRRKEELLVARERREQEKKEKTELEKKMKQHKANLRQAKPRMDWRKAKTKVRPIPRRATSSQTPSKKRDEMPGHEEEAVEKKMTEKERQELLKEKRKKQREEFQKFIRKNKAASRRSHASEGSSVEIFLPNGEVPVLHMDAVNSEAAEVHTGSYSAEHEKHPGNMEKESGNYLDVSRVKDEQDNGDIIKSPADHPRSENRRTYIDSHHHQHQDQQSLPDPIVSSTDMGALMQDRKNVISVDNILDRALQETNDVGLDEDNPQQQQHQQLLLQQQQQHQSQQNKLSVRIEHLRQYCEKKCGEDLFLELYHFLNNVSQDDDDDSVQQKLVEILERSNMSIMDSHIYISKINQLIYVEQLFYG